METDSAQVCARSTDGTSSHLGCVWAGVSGKLLRARHRGAKDHGSRAHPVDVSSTNIQRACSYRAGDPSGCPQAVNRHRLWLAWSGLTTAIMTWALPSNAVEDLEYVAEHLSRGRGKPSASIPASLGSDSGVLEPFNTGRMEPEYRAVTVPVGSAFLPRLAVSPVAALDLERCRLLRPVAVLWRE